MIASEETVSRSVLVRLSVASSWLVAVTVRLSVLPLAASERAVASMTKPNRSPGARVGVWAIGVALSATPSMLASA